MSDILPISGNLAERYSTIEELERRMLEHPQAPCDVVHSFAPGLYIREVRIPAGTLAIGHFQKCEHLNVMIAGRVTMIEPDGTRVERRAPLTFIGKPGRKVGYIHEDMVWLNIYATHETDIATLEATYLDKSEGWQQAQALIAQDRIEDINDFHAVLEELGVSEEVVRLQSQNLSDQRAFPHGSFKVKLAASRIEGLGLFATALIQPGEIIAPARIKGLRTPAGRYTNHAKTPNAVMAMRTDGDIDLIALREIRGCHGGQDGEEITVDYREAVRINRLSFNRGDS